MRNHPGVREPSFLSDCFQVPEVRDRLERGVKIQELANLKLFLENSRAEALVQKQYGYLIQDLEFLESEGAMKLPVVRTNTYVSVVPHWVALKGYFEVDEHSLSRVGMMRKFIINAPSIRSPLLCLDADAWGIYKLILSSSRMTKYQAISYLVYILEVLAMTESPFGDVVDDRYVQHVVWTTSHEEVQEQAIEAHARLVESQKFDDPLGIIPLILTEDYCLPTNSWIFSDGNYFLLSVPSWTLSSQEGMDFSDNYVESWDFFSVE